MKTSFLRLCFASLLAFFMASASGNAQTEEPESTPTPSPFKLSLHGELRHETAVRLQKPQEISKNKDFAYLELSGKFSRSFGFNVSGRGYYDSVFDFPSPLYDRSVERDQQWDAALRNAYVDISAGPMGLRLGKQQIVWGEAVNLFFADVVNPRDMREFLLPDLKDIRIPLWAADLEFFFGNTHLEFIAIPVLEHDRLGVPGSEFAFSAPSLPPGAELNVAEVRMPANNARNGVYGFRLGQFVKGWDLNGFYLYGYDYTPTFFRTIDFDETTETVTVNVNPEITRKRTVGATFSKDLGGLILKGEFVYDRERNFVVDDPAHPTGIVKSDYFEYLLGVDYTFFRKLDFNAQVFQQYILNPVGNLYRPDRASYVSIWLKTGFWDNHVEPEFFAVARIPRVGEDTDFMFRPKLNFNISNHIQAAVGADLFGGDPAGSFGQYEEQDRVFVSMRLLF